MSYSFDKRRTAPAGREVRQSPGAAPMGTFLPDASNSAQIAMLDYRDAPGAAGDLKAAMDAKAAALIGGTSGPLARFGRDYVDAGAEAEADRIGNRFSGASGVEDLKSRMGSALGADFSGVRFHSGAEASAMADASDAEAFTTGRDIYLGGPFNAATAAHEMVHTIQQGAVQASVPVASAPAGSVQYKERPHFRNTRFGHWLEKKTVGAHHEALDQLVEFRNDYKAMSRGQRALWSLKNPLARIRGRNAVGAQNEGYRARKALRDEEDTAAKEFGKRMNWAREVSPDEMSYGSEALGDADLGFQMPASNEYEFGKVGNAAERVTGAVDKLGTDLGTDTGLSLTGTPFELTGVADSSIRIDQYAGALKEAAKTKVLASSEPKIPSVNLPTPKAQPKRVLPGQRIAPKNQRFPPGKPRIPSKPDVLNEPSLPKPKVTTPKMPEKAEVPKAPDKVEVPDSSVGMTAANGVGAAFAVMGDTASLVQNSMEAHKQRKQGNKLGARISGVNAAADGVAGVADVMSAIPVGPVGVIGSGLSGVANTMKAGASFHSARRNNETMHSMEARQAKFAQDAADLQNSAPGQMSAEDRKYILHRDRIAKQLKGAAYVHRNQDLVSGASSTVKAVGNFAATGLGAAALATTAGVLDPVSGIVNAIGSAGSAVAEGIGNAFVRNQRRQLRRDTVEEELNLEDKIRQLKADPSLAGINHELSDKEAKHIILKSMGFKSGKRKEAFNQITMRRAAELAERANDDNPNRWTDEKEMMKEMFLEKDANGQFNIAAIAEKLGLEEMDDRNPFKKHARPSAAAGQGGGAPAAPPQNTANPAAPPPAAPPQTAATPAPAPQTAATPAPAPQAPAPPASLPPQVMDILRQRNQH